ncbi:hypothetical protein QIH87_50045 (plasmid) [Bradyrhizobium elkanii]|uniref:hypothetical protein n=1 Tax=Bradyrhizobium elkanii TaxID=29448 RepID=UPI002226F09C|nr:hypothetical protein [Bradyrhizobium elkanii]MCW2228123.1 hypothetical protein [Bradyrhizobium elkanii]WLB14774.1 hypothetical protein QIH87_50045 [Bradyrhizobium elkanii]WLB69134.1 hypothetical protein QIH89_27870 [Bradyrhizobium elkanii]
MAEFTSAPWCIPPGSETCICAGDDGSKPGKILFVLRGPSGTREVYSHELLSEYSTYIAKVVNSHDALVKALAAMISQFGSREHKDCDCSACDIVRDAREALALTRQQLGSQE